MACFLSLILVVASGIYCHGDVWSDLRLPTEHLPYYFYNNLEARKLCQEREDCPYKEQTKYQKCWGYENRCPARLRMSMPTCPVDVVSAWAPTKEAQIEKFWVQSDFGYLKERKDEMRVFCEPTEPDGGYLACIKYTRYCRARNILFDFKDLQVNTLGKTSRYREDVFHEGQVGGYCKFNKATFSIEGEHKSPLQSWFAELEKYTGLDYDPIAENKCDVIIDKPTMLIKLDAGVNMYHHFCDYINLYAAQHLNNSFSTDINIVMWDTSPMKYGDFFHDTWKAFTDHPIIHLKDYDGKKVCFKDAVFSLLARMRYGLYYNMPLIPGCEGSGLFRAFSQHILHRLGVTQEGPMRKKVRITLLDRKSKYRNILNHKELVHALKTVGEYEVKVAVYSHELPFIEQLQITHNTDILIGMHGAGLTHLLFQPDWATIFEIYNCDDRDCYQDLARQRGLHYLTWQKKEKLIPEDEGHHPTLGAHEKFTNYAFDVTEFMRLIRVASDKVNSNPSFIAARKAKYEQSRDEL